MPHQLNRCFTLVRLLTISSILLLTTQIALPHVSAAPANQDGELSVSPAPSEDEEAAESAQEAEEAEAPAIEDGESQADDAPAAEPAPDEPELMAEPGPEEPAEGELLAEPAPEDDQPGTEPVAVEADAAPVASPADEQAAAAPVAFDDEVDDHFLRRLLDAINERRRQAGTPRLTFIPARANAALESFLANAVPGISWPGSCDHNPIDGAFSWDYISAAGFGGSPRGEVIACPGPEPYWTPDRAAEQWWDSPIHHGVLYADGESNAIACSAYGVEGGPNGKKKEKTAGAASAVLCVTFRG